MDGSFTTTPDPWAYTQVLAVPRSIARSTPLTQTPLKNLEEGNARALANFVPRAERIGQTKKLTLLIRSVSRRYECEGGITKICPAEYSRAWGANIQPGIIFAPV